MVAEHEVSLEDVAVAENAGKVGVEDVVRLLRMSLLSLAGTSLDTFPPLLCVPNPHQ